MPYKLSDVEKGGRSSLSKHLPSILNHKHTGVSLVHITRHLLSKQEKAISYGCFGLNRKKEMYNSGHLDPQRLKIGALFQLNYAVALLGFLWSGNSLAVCVDTVIFIWYK